MGHEKLTSLSTLRPSLLFLQGLRGRHDPWLLCLLSTQLWYGDPARAGAWEDHGFVLHAYNPRLDPQASLQKLVSITLSMANAPQRESAMMARHHTAPTMTLALVWPPTATKNYFAHTHFQLKVAEVAKELCCSPASMAHRTEDGWQWREGAKSVLITVKNCPAERTKLDIHMVI